MTRSSTLIVGIGSPHGDDQAGWQVAQSLMDADIGIGHVELCAARSPVELLDRLEGVDQLILCDACRGNDPVGRVRRWQWPAPQLQRVEWSGTHDLGLCTVLELAEQLGQLPHEVILWSIQADHVDPESPISAEVEAAARVVAARIQQHLRCETTVAGMGQGDA